MQFTFFSSFEALHIFRMSLFKGKRVKKGTANAKEFEKIEG
jgi:hypothetical protein